MNNFDPANNVSWKLGHRGRVAVFIDGNNLFHAARFHNIDIDYNKLLRVLLGDGRLLRAFFYTGVDVGAERQQGFLLWMRRNGFRVIQKELKTFYDGSRKANLDVEIAVDMLSLAGRYDTAVLVSGDEDFVYAVNLLRSRWIPGLLAHSPASPLIRFARGHRDDEDRRDCGPPVRPEREHRSGRRLHRHIRIGHHDQ